MELRAVVFGVTEARRERGAILFEALFTALVWGVLLTSTHMAVTGFWGKRTRALDRERLHYDGIMNGDAGDARREK